MLGPANKLPSELREQLAAFTIGLQIPMTPGRFLPCREGMTEQGRSVSLGFSCLAHKVYFSLNLLEDMAQSDKMAWIEFIKSFQQANPLDTNTIRQNAFVDPPLVEYLKGYKPRLRRLVLNRFKPMKPSQIERTIIAETKQAIATLAEAGEVPDRVYHGYPTNSRDIQRYLGQLGWSRPWAAGSHAAALAVFLETQAPKAISADEIDELIATWSRFIQGLVDTETGAYFQGPVPGWEMLVNGAMKVLTGLDWLSIPIHRPERLIDTTLRRLPAAEGCNLVDAVYVLYRCLEQTDYRKLDVIDYMGNVIDMIMLHHNPDGGFSYYVGQSQRSYYGVPITNGLHVSDIHGTCLLAWALAMINKVTDKDAAHWRVIKP